MRQISKSSKGFRFLLYVIDVFSKYAWVVPLKDIKGVSIVDKGSEFYSNFFKETLKDNDIEMHSIYNEGKSVVAERFIKHQRLKSTNT